MIDHHSEYKHGLASDMRRRHLPASDSLNGWDFSPEPQPCLRAPFLIAVAAVVLVGLCLIASIH